MSGASSSTHVFCKEKERKPIISIYTLDGMPGGARTHNIDVGGRHFIQLDYRHILLNYSIFIH